MSRLDEVNANEVIDCVLVRINGKNEMYLPMIPCITSVTANHWGSIINGTTRRTYPDCTTISVLMFFFSSIETNVRKEIEKKRRNANKFCVS